MILALLASVTVTGALAEDVVPIRLVSMVDRDDRGEAINFPVMLFYDYWTSETYLLSSTGRITVYDQKYFPLVSFGQGRGLLNPLGLAVDRRGSVYVCTGPVNKGPKARLVILNQAFFQTKEIVFANIPELADFTAIRVAVAENGEIYLAGYWPLEPLDGVAVLSPEGKFLRFLRPPGEDAWRPLKKAPAAAVKVAPPPAPAAQEEGQAGGEQGLGALKPKSKSAARSLDADEEKGQMGPAQIADVKIDRQGRIYLLSREVGSVYVFDSGEKYLFKFGEKGGAAGKLSNPVSLGIDLERRVIYVCDYMRHTVLCYDYDSGRYIFEFGGRGTGALWFNFPNSVEADQRGRVVVSDLFNRRLQVIDPNMGERRPLAGALVGLASGSRPPGGEAPPPVKPPAPEIESPSASTTPGPVTLASPPTIVAPSSLPAPSPPPAQALLVAPAGGVLPRGVLPLSLPSLAGGPAVAPLRIPLAAVSAPPARPAPSVPVRELAPRQAKKKVAPAGPDLAPVIIAPPAPATKFPRPSVVRFPAADKAGARAKGVAGEPVGILARFRSMPAAVGVYGPVAALLGVGSWLLYTNR